MQSHCTQAQAGTYDRTITGRFAARALLAGLAVLAFTSSPPALAQTYPERPIKLVVPFPAGGPTDVAARLVAQSLGSRLGQNTVIENVAGAGGRIGAKSVAEATPDGYTLLLGGTNVNAVAASLAGHNGFDPISSFAPIASTTVDSMVLVVSPHVPAENFEQFLAYARANPGKLSYGAPPGIYIHFATEFFKAKTGTDIVFIPYTGGAPAIRDLLGGHIDVLFNNKSTLLTNIQEGKLRALAVTSQERWPELPGTPTMTEVGVSGFPKEIWFGLLAPAATPKSIIQKLNGATNEGLRSPESRATLAKLGMEAKLGSPEDFARVLQQQVGEWRAVIEATGQRGSADR